MDAKMANQKPNQLKWKGKKSSISMSGTQCDYDWLRIVNKIAEHVCLVIVKHMTAKIVAGLTSDDK